MEIDNKQIKDESGPKATPFELNPDIEEKKLDSDGDEFDVDEQEQNIESEELDSTKEFKYKISGENPIIFDEPDIDQIDITNAGRDIIKNYFGSHAKISRGKKYSCPKCGAELIFKEYGKQVCEKCKKPFTLRNQEWDKDIVLYKTLTPDEAKRYDKILAHISNNLQENKHDIAFEYCRKAEELAPGEVATWVYFALSEFLFEIKKNISIRKPTAAIIKEVRFHIEKCKNHGMTEEECKPLYQDIAKQLFEIEKGRINSVQTKYRDHANNPKWSRFNFNYLQRLLESFDLCYQLDKSCVFLEGYVDELKKEYKWIVKTADGELLNTPACGSFNAVKKLNDLVQKIKKEKDGYEFPDIAEERFVIKKEEYLKINSLISKSE